MSNIWYVAKTYINPVLIASFISYLFTWGFTSLGIVGLVSVGVSFHEAEAGMLMLAFLLLLIVFLSIFISSQPGKTSLILLVTGAFMTTAAWQLQFLIIN
ncbi:MAG: iron uptake protein [Gammaproteobacteria bacterium]